MKLPPPAPLPAPPPLYLRRHPTGNLRRHPNLHRPSNLRRHPNLYDHADERHAARPLSERFPGADAEAPLSPPLMHLLAAHSRTPSRTPAGPQPEPPLLTPPTSRARPPAPHKACHVSRVSPHALVHTMPCRWRQLTWSLAHLQRAPQRSIRSTTWQGCELAMSPGFPIVSPCCPISYVATCAMSMSRFSWWWWWWVVGGSSGKFRVTIPTLRNTLPIRPPPTFRHVPNQGATEPAA